MADSESIVGVDLSSLGSAQGRRTRVIAVRAQVQAWNRYAIALDDFNRRLFGDSPGWTLRELCQELVEHPARIVGLNCPFSIPNALLCDEPFARAVGSRSEAFVGWRTFNWHVAWHLRHRLADVIHANHWPDDDQLDFSGFAAWHRKDYRLQRDTDRFAGAPSPLEDVPGQSLLQMTLAGNVLLDFIGTNGKYRIVPLWSPEGYKSEAIEVFPDLIMGQLGLPDFRREREKGLLRLFEYLREMGTTMAIAPELFGRLASSATSGNGRAADFDMAPALVVLGTAMLYRDGHCAPAVDGRRWENSTYNEGVIWCLKNRAVR